MRALKILVYGMGVVLVVGVIVLVVTIAYRLKHPRHPTEPARVETLSAAPHLVALPPGAKVLGVQNDGDRVLVRLGFANGGEQLLLVDWKSGAVLATLNLK